jgi:UDP-N-acetyl-D-mannosaminuronic acid dehydrogenase
MSIPTSFKDKNISIIGLGYVGLTLAVAMADTGFNVQGVEKRQDILDSLDKGKPHFHEARLEEKLQRVKALGKFVYSNKLDPARPATVYIITVGTPLDKLGNARLDMAQAATGEVVAHMRDGALVILRSTVKMGTTRKIVRPILEASNKHYELAFCPERTLEGRALIELHELPQVIGADDAETRWRCQQLFNLMTPTTVAVSSLETAELVKLTDNTFRDLSFAFSNEIAKLCGRAGISALEVIRAGKLGYPRTNLKLPGPVGGPCLEKDPHILVESAKQWGVDMPITQAGRTTNEAQPKDIAHFVRHWAEKLPKFSRTPKISLLGLAFKGVPETDDLRGTMALPILRELQAALPKAVIKGFDPVAEKKAAEDFLGISIFDSIAEAFDGADIVLILTNHNRFLQMDLASLAAKMNRPALVYDLWNMYDDVGAAMPEGVLAISLGAELLVKSIEK